MDVTTVTVADPETVPEVAVIVVVPAERAVTKPVALTEAIAGLDEDQTLEAVRSLAEKFVYEPEALNCWVPPTTTFKVLGEIVSEVRFAGVTVSMADTETVPRAASIVDVPWATP